MFAFLKELFTLPPIPVAKKKIYIEISEISQYKDKDSGRNVSKIFITVKGNKESDDVYSTLIESGLCRCSKRGLVYNYYVIFIYAFSENEKQILDILRSMRD